MKNLAALLFVILMVVIYSPQKTHGQDASMDMGSLAAKFIGLMGDKGKREEEVSKYLKMAEPFIPGISKAYASAKGKSIMDKLKAIIPLIAAKVPALTSMMG